MQTDASKAGWVVVIVRRAGRRDVQRNRCFCHIGQDGLGDLITGPQVVAEAFDKRSTVSRKPLYESVLVPNPFYRLAKAPVFQTAATFDFQDKSAWDKLRPLMGSIGAPGAAEKDAAALVAFLDSQPQVDQSKKIGTQGYCMGGPLVVRTAAAVPDRIGAGASFHGGGLVSDKPESPHLLAPKIKARMYFGVASNDDRKQPDAKDKLKEAFAAAKNPATVEVYAASHGWCVPDMPLESGVPIYNKPEAEQAWAKLIALYGNALA